MQYEFNDVNPRSASDLHAVYLRVMLALNSRWTVALGLGKVEPADNVSCPT
jgi:hypothetical protein